MPGPGEYTYQQKTYDDLNNPNKKSKYQEKLKLGHVRTAVTKVKSNAYELIDRKMTNDNEEARKVAVHSAKGKAAMESGKYVFELNIAGSSFTEFRACHKNLPGKHAVQPDLKDKTSRIKFQKPIKVSWYNKYLSFLPFIKSTKEIEKLNAASKIVSDELDRYYGKRWTNPKTGKPDKYIRTKRIGTNQKSMRVNLPGPLGTMGTNRGDYSINELRDKTLYFAKQYLTERFEAFKNGSEPVNDIVMNMKGHSRGAVAAGEGMQMIAAWVKDNYPQYENLVKYDLIQYEPVPGYGSHGNHAKLELNTHYTPDQQGIAKRKNPAAENINSTVMYSLSASEDLKHHELFDPQQVLGAKRVILTVKRHMLQLADTDLTQNEQQLKQGFSYAGDGDIYRGSGISDLPEGIFIVDENNTIVKLDNMQQVKSVMDSVLDGAKVSMDRKKILESTVSKWFERNNPELNRQKEEQAKFYKEMVNEVLETGGTFTVLDTPLEKERLASAFAYQFGINNKDALSPKELKDVSSDDNIHKIMNSPGFKKTIKELEGQTLDFEKIHQKFTNNTLPYKHKDEPQPQRQAQTQMSL